MCRILIFGGTTEGRLLAEYCHQQEIEAYVSVVSGYGADLLPEVNISMCFRAAWPGRRWKAS